MINIVASIFFILSLSIIIYSVNIFRKVGFKNLLSSFDNKNMNFSKKELDNKIYSLGYLIKTIKLFVTGLVLLILSIILFLIFSVKTLMIF